MNTLLYDVRFALRQMQESTGFAILAVLTLSLGVGAATTIFSVVNSVILHPLPYDHPQRIYVPQTIAREGYTQPFSWLSYLDTRAQSHSFAAPLLGRTFRPGEDQHGKNDVAVLSYEVWRTDFAGKPNVIGQTLQLDGKPYTCIGVMPPGFRYPLSVLRATLADLRARARVAVRIDRLAGGNFGDSKSIGEGLHELRIDWGPGYRVYFGIIETACVLLLCGGDKRKQFADIRKAREYWSDYKKRTELP